MLWIVFIAVAVFFAGLSALLYFGQGRMIFQPTSRHEHGAEKSGLGYEDVRLPVGDDQKIHGWYFPCELGDTAPTVLFFHGNAGNISHRLSTAQFFVGLGVNFFMFDYRGYGQSDGSPSEDALYADARAAYDWLLVTKGIDPDRLFLFGRSLGGAVAVDLATRVKCGGLVVESSFTSTSDMGQRMFPHLPVRLLVRYRFDSLGKIGRVNCPVLVTHSPDDEMIPYEMGRDLFDAAGPHKTFIPLEGRHNDRGYLQNDKYLNGLRRFLGLRPDSETT